MSNCQCCDNDPRRWRYCRCRRWHDGREPEPLETVSAEKHSAEKRS